MPYNEEITALLILLSIFTAVSVLSWHIEFSFKITESNQFIFSVSYLLSTTSAFGTYRVPIRYGTPTELYHGYVTIGKSLKF